MDSEQESNLPEAVYFDTNVLRQLSSGVSNVDFIELRKQLDSIRVGLFAPDVVVREWIQNRVEEISCEIQNIKKASQKLDHLLSQEPVKYEEPKDFETNLESGMKQYLDSIGIKLVPTPKNIQFEVLIEMAIKKEAPFEKRGEDKAFAEKGFRDTIILFTIIEHMKDNGFRNAILLSADRVFTKDAVTTRLKNDGLHVLVAKDIVEANGQMKKQIDAAVKSFIEEKEQTIKSFLVEHSDQIFDYVLKNAQVSESFLAGQDRLFGISSVEAVLSIRPKEISKVSLGHTLREEALPKGVEPITFSVSTDFDLLVREDGISWLLNQPKFSLSVSGSFQKMESQFPKRSVEQKAVTREITVEATILKSGDNYSDLKLLRILTY